MAARTGWYRLANGERGLVTWSASGGLVAIDFAGLEQDGLMDDAVLLSGASRDPSAPYSVEYHAHLLAEVGLVVENVGGDVVASTRGAPVQRSGVGGRVDVFE